MKIKMLNLLNLVSPPSKENPRAPFIYLAGNLVYSGKEILFSTCNMCDTKRETFYTNPLLHF